VMSLLVKWNSSLGLWQIAWTESSLGPSQLQLRSVLVLSHNLRRRSCPLPTVRSRTRSIICRPSPTRGNNGVEIRAQHVELDLQILWRVTDFEMCIPGAVIRSNSFITRPESTHHRFRWPAISIRWASFSSSLSFSRQRRTRRFPSTSR
jgi:hypothetical protein